MKTIAAVIALLAFSFPVVASHCSTYSTTDAEVDTGIAGDKTRYYVSFDAMCSQCHVTFWVYQESNGIDGLQRGDEIADDTCHEMISPDTIHF